MKALRILALLACATLTTTAQTTPKNFQPHMMVAAANPLAAAAGLEMLKAHGSAVDAAIATQLVLNLVEPESSGIGGGAFMLVYDPQAKKTTSFDGREVAPASAKPGMFLDATGQPRAHNDPIPGGLSVGIPGVVGMMELAHKKYGTLPWPKLFEPAIRIAENGFPIGPKLARTIEGSARMKNMPDIARMFFHADGTPMKEGEIFKNPELAQTFRTIAASGAKAFYTGPIAQAIVDAVQHAPGKNQGGMTMADLAGFQARELNPVCGDYRTWHLCSMGLPSSGGVAIVQILGMLQRFPASDLKPNSLLETHLFTQASRLAYADRAKYLGDVSAAMVNGLLDKGYIASRAALIDPKKDMGTAQAGNPPENRVAYAPQVSPENHGTS
ncbi:MAG: gamma-glutamyltransferase, partial [Acidobacteriaceae bacterium]|nr:gamma-glutamyltransferase [Acidobacteriaceae bacterium]